MSLKKLIVAAVAALSIVTTVPATAHAASNAHAITRPCKYEDSTNCYWNAGTAGNGRGHSFYAVRVAPGLVCVLYTEPRYALRHNYCEPRS